MLHVASNPFEPLDDKKPLKLKKYLENSKLKGKTLKVGIFGNAECQKSVQKGSLT